MTNKISDLFKGSISYPSSWSDEQVVAANKAIGSHDKLVEAVQLNEKLITLLCEHADAELMDVISESLCLASNANLDVLDDIENYPVTKIINGTKRYGVSKGKCTHNVSVGESCTNCNDNIHF